MSGALPMPSAPWQRAQFVLANCLPSAISIGVAVSVRMSASVSAGCAVAAAEQAPITALATTADIRRCFMLRCLAMRSLFVAVNRYSLPLQGDYHRGAFDRRGLRSANPAAAYFGDWFA